MRAVHHAIVLVLVAIGLPEHATANCTMGFELALVGFPDVYYCLRCETAYYKNTFGPQPCSPCPVGTYGNRVRGNEPQNRSYDCLACGRNTFQDQQAKRSCKACAVGKFFDGTQASSCTMCPPGQQGSNSGGCQECGAGTYKNSTDQLECLQCNGVGTYQDNEGATTCLPCPTGQYQNTPGATECIPCNIGKHSHIAGASACAPCPAGKYANESGLAQCSECPRGTFALHTGATTCGTDLNPPSDTCHHPVICQGLKSSYAYCYLKPVSECGLESACSNHATRPNANMCSGVNQHPFFQRLNSQAVSDEEWRRIWPQSGPNSISCHSLCSSLYPPNRHFTRIYSITTGTTSSDAKVTSCCFTRLASEVKNATGSIIPEPTHEQIYQDRCSDFSAQCAITCGENRAANSSGACQQCARGTFKSGNGTETCVRCVAGKFWQSLSYTPYAACVECPRHQYRSDGDVFACLPCPNGTYANLTGASVCATCGAGLHVPPGGEACAPCAAHTYRAANDTAPCLPCPNGTYANWTGASVCATCGAGLYVPVGETACAPCAAHTYKAANDTGSCLPCPNGTYANWTGASVCAPCGAGLYVPVGETACAPCTAHTYKAANDTARCIPCPNGTHANHTGATACAACAAGQFLLAGVRECAPCPNGTFGPDEGRAACVPCPQHSTTARPGATSDAQCVCVANAVRSALSKLCTPCAAGTTIGVATRLINSSSMCSVNYTKNLRVTFSDFSYYYSTWTHGNYNTEEKWINKVSSDMKELCDSEPKCDGFSYITTVDEMPSGSQFLEFYMQDTNFDASNWKIQGKDLREKEYIMNRHCYWKGEQCDSCPVGSYSTHESAGCDACPRGTFSDTTGATVCMRCDAGKSTSAVGSTARSECVACTPGYYSSYTSGLCEKCTPGKFQESSGLSWCDLCLAGKISDTAAALCTDCPAGKYNQLANGLCIACAPGTRQPQIGASSCLPCVEGETSTERRVECVCSVGYTRDTQGNCSQCAPGEFGTSAAFELSGGGACPAAAGVVGYMVARGIERGQCEAACRELAACTSFTLATTPWNNPALCYLHLTNASLAHADTAAITAYGAFANDSSAQSMRLRDVNESGLLLWCHTRTQRATCELCAPGTFSGAHGMTACTACAVGTYSAVWGAGACVACPANSSTREAGARSPVQCACRAGYGRADASAGFEGACTACGAGRAHAHDAPEAFEPVGEGECRGPPRHVFLASNTGSAPHRAAYNSTEPSPVFHAAHANMSEAQCAALCALQRPCIGYAHGSRRPGGAAECLVYLPESAHDFRQYYSGWGVSGDADGRTLASSITTASGGWSVRCMRKVPTALDQQEFADEAYDAFEDLYSVPSGYGQNKAYCDGKSFTTKSYNSDAPSSKTSIEQMFAKCERTFLCAGYVLHDTISYKFHLLFEDKTKTYSDLTGFPVTSGCILRQERNPWACRKCQRGTFAQNVSAAKCVACRVGTYQENRGGTSCSACPVQHQETQRLGAVMQDACRCIPGYAGDSCTSCSITHTYDPGRQPRTYTQFRGFKCAAAPGRRHDNLTRAACEHACSQFEHCKAYEHDSAAGTCTLYGTYIDEGLPKWTSEHGGQRAWRGVRADEFSGSTWQGAPGTPNTSCYALDDEPSRVCTTCPHQGTGVTPWHKNTSCRLQPQLHTPSRYEEWLAAVNASEHLSVDIGAPGASWYYNELHVLAHAEVNITPPCTPPQYNTAVLRFGIGFHTGGGRARVPLVVGSEVLAVYEGEGELYAEVEYVVTGLAPCESVSLRPEGAWLHRYLTVQFQFLETSKKQATYLGVIQALKYHAETVSWATNPYSTWRVDELNSVIVQQNKLLQTAATFHAPGITTARWRTAAPCALLDAQLGLWLLEPAAPSRIWFLEVVRNSTPSRNVSFIADCRHDGRAYESVSLFRVDPAGTLAALLVGVDLWVQDLMREDGRCVAVQGLSTLNTNTEFLLVSSTVLLVPVGPLITTTTTTTWHAHRLDRRQFLFLAKARPGRTLCAPGQARAAGLCATCQRGSYKDWFGDEPCVPCPTANTTTTLRGVADPSGCVCRAGYKASQAQTCVRCANNEYSVPNSTACMPCPRSDIHGSGARCACPAGQAWGDGSECEACPRGTYKASSGTAFCTACRGNSETRARASTRDADCMCPAGHSAPPGNAPRDARCPPCAPGAHAALPNATACTLCPAGTFAPFPAATSCTRCPSGMHAAAAGRGACTVCPRGTDATENRTACVPAGTPSCGDGVGLREYVTGVREDLSMPSPASLQHAPGGVP